MRISDEQARELWQRAAAMQTDADKNVSALVPVEQQGLTLEQVALAAEGAGIDPDRVRVAVAEQQLPDAHGIDPKLWTARWVRALLREPDVIEVSHLINAKPSAVFDALKSVAARPTFDLVLETTVGNNPVKDAVLVYRRVTDKTKFQDDLDWADARVLLCTIREEDEQTRLRIRVPLFRRGLNLGLMGGASGIVGFGGLSVANGIVASVPAALATTTAAALLPVVGFIAGAGVAVGIYKALYRVTYKGGLSAVRQLVQTVATEAESASSVAAERE